MKKVVVSSVLAAVLLITFCAFGIMPVDTDPIDQSITVMYSKDGRILEVPNEEVEAYKNVDWYENYSDVITTVWANDGRSNVIYKADEEAYLSVGWYSSREEVVTTLYREVNGNEESKEVFKGEVEKYLAEGWKRSNSKVDPEKPMVALTFDDGPKAATTNRILDALEKHGARATFYLLGSRAEAEADCVKRMYDLGCEVSSHTFDHVQLTKLSRDEINEQVDKTNNAINSIIGINATTLRPPYGSYNDEVKSAVGMPLILWSIDTLDWETRNADSIFDTVISKVKDGDIILMHDIYEFSAEAAERLIPALQDMGFQLVTVEELGNAKGGINSGEVYTDFRKSTIERRNQPTPTPAPAATEKPEENDNSSNDNEEKAEKEEKPKDDEKSSNTEDNSSGSGKTMKQL